MDISVEDDWDGQTAIVDGYTGTLYLNPDEETKKEYRIRLEADKKEKEELLQLKNQSDETKDGRKTRSLRQYRKYERSEQCTLLWGCRDRSFAKRISVSWKRKLSQRKRTVSRLQKAGGNYGR